MGKVEKKSKKKTNNSAFSATHTYIKLTLVSFLLLFFLCTFPLELLVKNHHMIHMGLGIDLPSSSQHSLPMPRGAPTLNHIGAQQLSLWNWVLLAFVVRVTMHGAIDDVGKDKVNIRSAHHSYDGGDNDLPSGQVALTSLHCGSVRSSKAEEKLLSLRNV